MTSLPWPGSQDLRRLARRVTHQEIAGQGAGIGDIGDFGRDEEDAGGFTAEPMRAGLAHVEDHVVNVGAVVGAGFGELHPLIFGESGRHDDFLIFDSAAGGDVEGARESIDDIGLGDGPSFEECGLGGEIAGIAGGAPASAQAARVSMADCGRERSFENLP